MRPMGDVPWWEFEPLSAKRRRESADLASLSAVFAPRIFGLGQLMAKNRLNNDPQIREWEEEKRRLEEQKRAADARRREERRQRAEEMRAALEQRREQARQKAEQERAERERERMEQQARREQQAIPQATGRGLMERYALDAPSQGRRTGGGSFEPSKDRMLAAELRRQADNDDRGFLGDVGSSLGRIGGAAADAGRGAMRGQAEYSQHFTRPLAEIGADAAAYGQTIPAIGPVIRAARMGLEAPEALYEGITKGPLAGARRLGESFLGPRVNPRDDIRRAPGAARDPLGFLEEKEEEFGRRPFTQQLAGEVAADPLTYFGSGAFKAADGAGRVSRGLSALDRAGDVLQGGPLIGAAARGAGRVARGAGQGAMAGLKAPVLGMVGDTAGRAGRFADEAVGGLRPGQRVEIHSGAGAGQSGEVVGFTNGGKVKVRRTDGTVRPYLPENVRLAESDVSDAEIADRLGASIEARLATRRAQDPEVLANWTFAEDVMPEGISRAQFGDYLHRLDLGQAPAPRAGGFEWDPAEGSTSTKPVRGFVPSEHRVGNYMGVTPGRPVTDAPASITPENVRPVADEPEILLDDAAAIDEPAPASSLVERFRLGGDEPEQTVDALPFDPDPGWRAPQELVGAEVSGSRFDEGLQGELPVRGRVVRQFKNGDVLVQPDTSYTLNGQWTDKPIRLHKFEVLSEASAPAPLEFAGRSGSVPPPGDRPGTPPPSALPPTRPPSIAPGEAARMRDESEFVDLIGLMDNNWQEGRSLGGNIKAFIQRVAGRTPTTGDALRDANVELTEGLVNRFKWAVGKAASRNSEFLADKMKGLSKPFRIRQVTERVTLPDGRVKDMKVWRVVNVEGAPTMADIALAPNSYNLTAEQRAALAEMKSVRQELDEFETLYGVEVDHGVVEVADPDGFYWERIVTERMGEDRPMTPTPGGGSGIGSKKDFHRERRFLTQEEGIQQGTGYEHPLEAFLIGTRGRLKHAGDSWLAARIPEAPAGSPWTSSIYEPALMSGKYSEEVAQIINRLAKTPPEPWSAEWIATTLFNAPLTFLGAAMDLSALGLQGIKGLFNMPQTTIARFYDATLGSMVGQDWMRSLAGPGKHSGLDFEEKVALGLPFEGISDSEFTRAAGWFAPIDKATGALTGGKVAPFRGSAEAFRRFRVLLANEMFERSVANAKFVNKTKGQGKKAISTETKRRLARDAGRSAGISSSTPTPIEKTVFFAASFFRSQFEQLGKAAFDWKSVDGWIARKQMGQMFGLAAAATYGLNKAQGEDTDFDPFSSHFMRIKTGKDSWVSLIGPWESFIKLAATTGGIAYNETAGNLGAPNVEMPSYLSDKGIFAPIRSKASPAVALGYDIATGKDFRGNPLSFPESIPNMVQERMPFSLMDTTEDIAKYGLNPESAGRAAGRSLGFKIGVDSPTDQLNEATPEGDFHDARNSVKQQVREDNPDLWEAYLDNARPETRKYYEYADQLKADRLIRDDMLANQQMTQDEWNEMRMLDSVKLSAYGSALFGDAGGPEKTTAHAEYMRMIQEASIDGGMTDWDKVQGLRDLQSDEWNAEVDEDTDSYMGTPMTRAYRALKPVREAYQSISKYRGYAPEEAQMIDEAWDIVRSVVPPDASERDLKRAVFQLRGQYPPRVWRALRLRAFGRGIRENPMRERFKKFNPEVSLFTGSGLFPTWGSAYISQLMAEDEGQPVLAAGG